MWRELLAVMPTTLFLPDARDDAEPFVGRLHTDVDAVRRLPGKLREVGLELERIDNAGTTGN
jgi:hypothetical protein